MSNKDNKEVLIRSMQVPQMMIQKYQRYLPTAFDDSLTMLEKVNMLIEYLNLSIEHINYVSETLDEITKEQNERIKSVRDDFDTLNEWVRGEGLELSTVKVLDEWFDSGELAKIINENVFNMKADKVDLDDLSRQVSRNNQDMQVALNSKVGKGENETVTMGMLAPDIKQAINDGTWDISVNTSELEDNAVTFRKRTRLGEIAKVTLGSSSDTPNIVNVFGDRKIVFPDTFFILVGKNRYRITDGITLDFTSIIGQSTGIIIYFDVETKQFITRTQTDISNIPETSVLFATLYFNSTHVLKGAYLGCEFTVNGVPSNFYFAKDKSVTTKLRTSLGELPVITIGASGNLPNLNTRTGVLEFTSNIFIFHRDKRYISEQREIVWRYGSSTGYVVFYNTETGDFTSKAQTDIKDITENDIIFAVIYSLNNKWYMNINCDYTRDGLPLYDEYTVKSKNIVLYEYSVDNIVDVKKDSDLLGVGDEGSPFTYTNDTHETIYNLFDGLVNKDNKYIRKELMGYDTSTNSLPIYKYNFTPLRPSASGGIRDFPKITLGGSIHGGENTSVYALYYVFKRILDEWEDDEGIEYLRNNVQFSVIPVISPWEFNNKSYTNANGVNINRNFDYRWEQSTDTTKGNAPFSENESKIVRDWIIDEQPLFHIDCHVRGGRQIVDNDKLMWVANNTSNENYISLNVIEKMTRRWKRKYDLGDVDFYGYTTVNANASGVCKNYVQQVLNIPAVTWEGFSKSDYTGNSDSKQVIDMNVDYLIQYIINVLKNYK